MSAVIVSLTVENIMRISVVQIDAAGKPIVVIGGRNAQGKSTAMLSIAMAFGGKRLCPDKPIRDGEDKGLVRVVLSTGVVVTRTFWRTKNDDWDSKVIVEAADGAQYRSPQALLEAMVAGLSWDPLAFTRMKPEEQATMLRHAVGVDVSDLDRQLAALTTDRRDCGRDGKVRAGHLAGLQAQAPPAVPDEPAEDAGALAEELSRAEAAHEEMGVERERREHALRQRDNLAARAQAADAEASRQADSAATATARAAELRRMAEDADKAAADSLAAADRSREAADTFRARAGAALERVQASDKIVQAALLPDVRRIRERIKAQHEAEFRRTGAQAAADAHKRQVAAVEAEVASHRAQWDGLTKRIDAAKAVKLARLKGAAYPVDGLSLSEDGTVEYGGQPFAQASQAEQIRVATAMGLALNPELRVVLVREASLLDDESMAAMAELAAAAGAQVWLERVGTGGRPTVVIEDGAVAGGAE